MGNMDSTENPASGKPGRSHDALEAFRHRNFRLFTAARFLIISGIEMQSLAVGWQIYSITRRPLDLGLVGLAQFLPGLMLFWLGGHVADRFERRNVLLCCEAGFALCSLALLAITLRGVHGVGPIYCVLVGIGLIRVFNGPAGQAFIPLLVPAEIFPVASAWGSGVFNTATITGPLIGGLLYAAAGSPVPVYITAASALVLSAGLVGSHARARAAEEQARSHRGAGGLPLRAEEPAHPGQHFAGFVCRAAGRSGGPAAGVRPGDSDGRAARAGNAAGPLRHWARH